MDTCFFHSRPHPVSLVAGFPPQGSLTAYRVGGDAEHARYNFSFVDTFCAQ